MPSPNCVRDAPRRERGSPFSRKGDDRMDVKAVGVGLTDETTMSIAHVGDSRAYMIRDNQLTRVTNDHSWVFEQVQAGMLTEAEAEKHPLRNVITRALGGALQVVPDATEIDSKQGD